MKNQILDTNYFLIKTIIALHKPSLLEKASYIQAICLTHTNFENFKIAATLPPIF
jgi:hypothetical protein